MKHPNNKILLSTSSWLTIRGSEDFPIVFDNTIHFRKSPQELLRRAALAGPGLGGRREPLPAAEQARLLEQIEEAGLEPPAYLDSAHRWVDRRAKLFQAGDYPDKGVSVSAEALQTIAQNFDLPVPVLIEHSGSPLEMGYLTSVHVQGEELFGMVALTAEADAVVQASGAGALSVGLSPELDAIREISLVRTPRIPDAQLFSGSLESPAEADRAVQDWIRRGLIAPAQAADARDLLTHHFSMKPMLERLLKPTNFLREHAAAPQSPATATMLPEEVEFYQRHFPGIRLEEIAQYK